MKIVGSKTPWNVKMNRVYIRRRQYSDSRFEWVIPRPYLARVVTIVGLRLREKVTFSFSLGFYAFVLSEHSRY